MAEEYRPQLEDITQETYSWGSPAAVYRTGESPAERERKESKFGDAALILRRIVPYDKDAETRVVPKTHLVTGEKNDPTSYLPYLNPQLRLKDSYSVDSWMWRLEYPIAQVYIGV